MSENGKSNEEIGPELQSIQSMFETGKVKKMYDIVKLHPTLIIQTLSFNHGSYSSKLAKPEKFSVKDIIKLARLIKVDYNKLNEIIFKEALENIIAEEQSPQKKPKKRSTGRPKKKKG